MNRRLVPVLLFALIVASVTSYLVYRFLLVRVQTQGKTVSTSKLLVARHDLQVGALIHDEDIEEVSWGAPVPEDAAKSRTDLVGRGVVSTMFQNEPILERRLAPRGAGAGLAATIPMGMRAVAMRVNEVVGLAGFVLPGMRVDVLVAGNVPGASTTLCRTVLQNIEVLSAGQKIEKNTDGKPESAQVVNLLVTPDQAETLNLASEARIQLVLRNPLDTKAEITKGTSVARLFGVPENPPVRGPSSDPVPTVLAPAKLAAVSRPPASDTVVVFNGSKRTEEKFAAKGGSN